MLRCPTTIGITDDFRFENELIGSVRESLETEKSSLTLYVGGQWVRLFEMRTLYSSCHILAFN